MLRATIFGLGVGTLCAALAALDGVAAVEPAAERQPQYFALGGELVEQVAETGAGAGCFAPMLEELQRHPHWSIRLDDLEWDDVASSEPDERHASIVIDGTTAVWRDGWLPQSMTLAEDERRAVLAAFALDCRIDEAQPRAGYGGHYIGVSLGEDGPAVVHFRTRSFVMARMRELFEQIRARYVAGRAADLRGFSLELAGVRNVDRDEQDRLIYKPYRLTIREADLAQNTLEDRVRLLDWAMTRRTALPAGRQIVSGTLRAHGTSRPIAVDLTTDRPGMLRYEVFRELDMWAAVNHEYREQ
jgi:hypothetical protein